ncbi:signal peptidase I [bacterium]
MNMERKVLLIAIILIISKIILIFIMKKNHGDKFKKVMDEIMDWVNTGLSALFYAFLIMYFIVQAFKIPSGSMMNTLLIKDHLFVNKFIFGFRLPLPTINENDDGKKILKIKMKRALQFTDPKRRDVVVFVYPEDRKKDFIKRCIGLPGDKIQIIDKVLYVNDVPQDEPYTRYSDKNIFPDDPFLPLSYKNRDNFGPITVPENHYFMLGDNRDSSYDSRFWGPLHSDFIKGEALLIYWPLKRIRLIK